MLDSKSVYIRIKRLKKNLNAMSLELLLRSPKSMSEEIQKSRKKQNEKFK